MQMQSVFMEETNECPRMTPRHQNQSVVKREKTNEFAPPMFDLEEYEDFYLLAVDLPDKSGELQIVTDRKSESDPLATNIPFRCRALGNNVRTIYYEGQLWLLLPKNGFAPQLRSFRELASNDLLNCQVSTA